MQFRSHDEYLASQPAELRARLEEVQRVVEAQVPEATRTVSYNMPAFRLGRTFLYFAAFKSHIGIYPPVTADLSVIDASQQYRGPKGNLSFAHSESLPVELIGKVAIALAAQYRVS
jgi:uncharacterized protein YdhG (YjbR/CyaY superfamily)